LNASEELVVRIFAFYDVPAQAFDRQLPASFAENEKSVKIFVNQSGEADLAIVIGFAGLGSWVKCRPDRVYKVVNEPWHQGIFSRYIRRHSKCFSTVFTPHLQHDLDPRVKRWPGNLEWHLKSDFDSLLELAPARKTKQISTVMSTKSHLRGHKERLEFISRAEKEIEALERFGRGTQREIATKEEGLEDYRYSFALENSQQPDYFTEKLYDCLLTWTVPIYSGAPNLNQIFPAEAFVQIDISDTVGAIEKVKAIIADPSDYQNRLPALRQAREMLLSELGFHGFLKHLIRDADLASNARFERKRVFHLHSLDSLVHFSRDYLFAASKFLRPIK